jgi:hypothetical protein
VDLLEFQRRLAILRYHREGERGVAILRYQRERESGDMKDYR